MTYKDFISRLKEVKYISRIENGYSHIVCELLSSFKPERVHDC